MPTRPIAFGAVLALALTMGCAPTTPPGGAAGAPTGGAALAGAEWRVTHINGQPIIANSKVTMQFADGRVSGAASCNRFMGGATTSADGLDIQMSQMASTMMACSDALMRQEGEFLKVMGDVTAYSVDDAGALTLTTKDGRSVKAVRG
jgi:heat shock protein HslJ